MNTHPAHNPDSFSLNVKMIFISIVIVVVDLCVCVPGSGPGPLGAPKSQEGGQIRVQLRTRYGSVPGATVMAVAAVCLTLLLCGGCGAEHAGNQENFSQALEQLGGGSSELGGAFVKFSGLIKELTALLKNLVSPC